MLFGVALTPIVAVVSIDRREVVFVSQKKSAVGSESTVRAWLSSKGMENYQRLLEFNVAVRTCRSNHEGKWIHVAWITSELAFEPVLPSVKSAVMRQAPRRACCFRVVSRDLRDFTGVSIDISSTGMQIETKGLLKLGAVINLRLEPNMTGWESVSFKARVAWHYRDAAGLYRAGVEYVSLSEDSLLKLTELERHLELTSQASVLQGTLRDADLFLAKTSSPATDSDIESTESPPSGTASQPGLGRKILMMFGFRKGTVPTN